VVVADVYFDLSPRLLEAELAVATKPAERTAARQAHLDRLKELEKLTRERAAGGGTSPAVECDEMKDFRLEAEIQLLKADAAAPDDDPKVRKLLQERRDLCQEVVKVYEEIWKSGRVVPPRLLTDFSSRLLDADLALARTADERLKAYQTHLERLKGVEQELQSRAKKEEGIYTTADNLIARAARLEAEILLLRARGPAKE
jgi:hypothetical protein